MVATQGGRPILIPHTIVTYSLSHLSQTDKVRFYFALKGRNGNGGIISQTGIRQLAKTVILTDTVQEKNLIDFLTEWGCSYSTLQVLVKNNFPNHRQISRNQRKLSSTASPFAPTHSPPQTHQGHTTVPFEVHETP